MGGLTLPRSFRLGVVTATTVAGITRSELFYRNQLTDPTVLRHAATELAFHEPTALTGTIVRECNGLGGYSLSTACSTGVHAIGMAMRLIERGYFDGCVAVGSDALAILTIRGFASLTLLDAQGCRPFDAQRAGISLGEGAGALLLMSSRAAKNLGMTPLAMLSGWGASADCHHMTAPHPGGEGALKAMRMALSAGGVSEEQVDLIISHGTATPDNDAAEIGALKQLFTTPPPFCSLKRTLGHTLAASGVLETVLGIRAMQSNHIPPTAGFTMVDESIGLAPSPAKSQRIEVIVKNAFGFGGNNASLLITKGV
jgi:3-oxoacyl-(acyl-carrier-protein) synthase